MNASELLVAFTLGDSAPLGNIWRITAKKTDFYIDPLGEVDAFHLSAHGPSASNPSGHRFHVKADRKAVAAVRGRGDFVLYNLPRNGRTFAGQQLAPGVFRVARIRWSWHLQRPRYRQAASLPGPLPDITSSRSGARLSRELGLNDAADLDLIVSYGTPYWPDEHRTSRDNSRLGPLRNDAGMWLTATSYRRSQMTTPAPEDLTMPLPKPGDSPNRIMGAAPGRDETGEMYWFVESITSREVIEASRLEAEA
ncbi:hypothetical protein [Catenuloplanes indicus]|uniref:Uncharacterized protein n=1 Tax=Catenuloplanes indicus TaxID=137267 RepID=A0AAE3W0I0_9ACTN|nr:hypothetical protein [Catenuloplanes indicus]MDQ0366554.1 hypothetical protein [Catenuloplanes indicus]